MFVPSSDSLWPHEPAVVVPQSLVEGIQWPAYTMGVAASLLAIQQQLKESERWPLEALRYHQLRQLEALVRHSWLHVPFYRKRLAAAGWHDRAELTPELWARLPVLSRREVQDADKEMHSRQPPESHGPVGYTRTSGSTGMPLQGLKTQLAAVYWYAFMIREHLWHGRDPNAKLAVIRPDHQGSAAPPNGQQLSNWGKPIGMLYPSGPAARLDIRCSYPDQAAWLQREAPAYLLTFPSNLAQLARHCLDEGIRVPSLRQTRTFGEVVSEDAHQLCRDAFGVAIADVYSAEEVGYMALQCPEYGSYHLQSESLFLEILADDGRPCREGEMGQVVVSPLHNFAMPLLRYGLGDYAEPGPACACGRTLPVIRRILGKARNLLVLPSGEKRYAYHGGRSLIEIPAVVQFQVVQRTPTQIDLKLVVRRPLTPAEEAQARTMVLKSLRHPFDLRLVYVDAIARSPSGKYEDFLSEIV